MKQEIVKKAAKKYALIGLILLVCLPFLLFLIGLALFYFLNNPLNVGVDTEGHIFDFLSLLASIFIGVILMNILSKWAENNYERKTGNGYKISSLTLGLTFLGALIPTLNVVLMAAGVLAASILAIFMNREIKRKTTPRHSV